MKRYIALFRGINISGKNKIPMTELQKGFVELGFREVKTYLNSGNVIFSSETDDIRSLVMQVETMIKNQFDLDIPVFIISKEEMGNILDHAPYWWDDKNKEIYDNLIFMFPPTTFIEVFGEIGEPKEELEKIMNYKNVVFWSFNRKHYQKTNWWRGTANTSISSKLTIRTANTIRNIVKM